MRNPVTLVLALCLCVLLAACWTEETPTEENTQSSSAVSSETGTRNVSYVGVVSDDSVTIYQEGTHVLDLPDGRVVLLEASDPAIDLSSYIGEEVEVRGTARPTVEAGGTILSVAQVTVLSSSSESSASSARMCGGIAGFPCDGGFTCVDDPSDDCDPNAGGADCSGICVAASSSSVSSAVSSAASSVISSVASSRSAAQSSVATSAQSSVASPTANEEDIVAMSKQNYAEASQWTQQYCTSHIGFCIPAHRNWYYRSFGATTSNLWHVEFSIEDFESLHTGLIALNLVPGSSAEAGGQSGSVRETGSTVTGYLDWQENRHFEIVADARLRAAVEYMLSHITSFETPTQ